MSSTDRGAYCERCGSYLDLVAAVPVHSCPACHAIACQSCWRASRRRCDGCATTEGSATPRLRGALSRAKAVRGSLEALGAEIDALAAADAADFEEIADDVDLALMRARLDTLVDEGRDSLDRASPKSAARAVVARRQLEARASVLNQRLAALQIRRLRSPVADEAPAAAEPPMPMLAAPRRRLAGFSRLAVAAALGIGIVAIVTIPRALPGIGAPATSPGATIGEGVLGGAPAETTPTAATPDAADPNALAGGTRVTFDDLRMTVSIGSEWQIERGSGSQVTVAAFPSAMDRSLELATSAAGDGVTICRSLAAGHGGLAVDAWLDSAETRLLVMLAAPDGRRTTWLLTTAPAATGDADGVVPVVEETWYRFAIDGAAAAETSWIVRQLDPERTSSVAVVAEGGAGEDEAAAVCIGVADGAPGGRALIDNVTIGPAT